VRRVNLLAGLHFDFADRQHVPRAFVQQPYDLSVEFIDRLAMFGDVHPD